MNEPIKLAIGLPAYGSHLDVGHAAMWLGLGAMLANTQDKFTLAFMAEYHINGVDLCRNTIVYDAMKAECDWVFMIDADTFHRSTGTNGVAEAVGDAGADILQMIRDADRYDVDNTGYTRSFNGVGLIGAPVRGRGVGDRGVCVHGLTVDHDDQTGETYFGAKAWPTPITSLEGKVQPVGRIGGACIAVNLKWLRVHWPKGPWFAMVHDYNERPRNARGEDYFICDGIYDRGGLVLCDGRFVPSHVDRRKLVGED
jgi:hypothetical protein